MLWQWIPPNRLSATNFIDRRCKRNRHSNVELYGTECISRSVVFRWNSDLNHGNVDIVDNRIIIP
ncbi:hypothetical protein AVEN_186458-1, partial [Araneus ventricosus]